MIFLHFVVLDEKIVKRKMWLGFCLVFLNLAVTLSPIRIIIDLYISRGLIDVIALKS